MGNEEKKKLEGQIPWQQYDRVLLQIREEVNELYWLYKFFFAINSALVGIILLNKVTNYLILSLVIGIIVSVIWLFVLCRQRKWVHYWIDKLKCFKINFELENKYRMWPDKDEKERRSVWKALYFLPIGFIFIYFYLVLVCTITVV